MQVVVEINVHCFKLMDLLGRQQYWVKDKWLAYQDIETHTTDELNYFNAALQKLESFLVDFIILTYRKY